MGEAAEAAESTVRLPPNRPLVVTVARAARVQVVSRPLVSPLTLSLLLEGTSSTTARERGGGRWSRR